MDRRNVSHFYVAHRFSDEEHLRILLTCSEPDFAVLPIAQIVAVLADCGLYNS